MQNREYTNKIEQKLVKYIIKCKSTGNFLWDFFTGNINNVADDATRQINGN